MADGMFAPNPDAAGIMVYKDGGFGRRERQIPPHGDHDAPIPQVEQQPIQDPFDVAGLPKGEQSITRICSRGLNDLVSQAFCGKAMRPKSLSELYAALGLQFSKPEGKNGEPGNPAFALTGHSSALGARFVSSINPQVFVWTGPNQPTTFVATGFIRGEQIVEMVGLDPSNDSFEFYLLRFEQTCNANGGCTNGDLLTGAVESNWTKLSLYNDVDIEDTQFDCLECHQTDGPGHKRILRMQERTLPWTHWFSETQPGGKALELDYHTAHPVTEDFGARARGDDRQERPVDAAARARRVQAHAAAQRVRLADDPRAKSKQSNPAAPAGQQPLRAEREPDLASDLRQRGRRQRDPGAVPRREGHRSGETRRRWRRPTSSSLQGMITPDTLPDIRNVFLDDALSLISASA